jgi:hypothetical protein
MTIDQPNNYGCHVLSFFSVTKNSLNTQPYHIMFLLPWIQQLKFTHDEGCWVKLNEKMKNHLIKGLSSGK